MTLTPRRQPAKRTADQAGLESPPPQRQVPESTIEEVHTIDLGGEKVKLVIQIAAKQSTARQCSQDLDVKFFLRRNNNAEPKIGKLTAYTIDKTILQRNPVIDTQVGGPAWLKLLQVPADCEEDIESHAGDDDRVDETMRCFLRLFDSKGNVRPEVAQYQAELSASRIHYISTFEIYKIYRGKGDGLSRIVMTTYLSAIRNLEGQFAFEGTVILSPAPLGQIEMRINEQRANVRLGPSEYNATVEKLIKSYNRSDFQVWRAGNPQVSRSITIMGRTTQSSESKDSGLTSTNNETLADDPQVSKKQKTTNSIASAGAGLDRMRIPPYSSPKPQGKQPTLRPAPTATNVVDESDAVDVNAPGSGTQIIGTQTQSAARTGFPVPRRYKPRTVAGQDGSAVNDLPTGQRSRTDFPTGWRPIRRILEQIGDEYRVEMNDYAATGERFRWLTRDQVSQDVIDEWENEQQGADMMEGVE